MFGEDGSKQNSIRGLDRLHDRATHVTDYILELSGWVNHKSVIDDSRPKSDVPSVGTVSGKIYTANERLMCRAASIPVGVTVIGIGIVGSLERIGVL